jgi:hypothetical protein
MAPSLWSHRGEAALRPLPERSNVLYSAEMVDRVFRIVRYIPPESEEEWPEGTFVNTDSGDVAVHLGEDIFYETSDGRVLVQKDYRVAGEVWQVHKFDADPFPSRPHAHCVGGRQKFIGLKLHLGTRQLWNEPRAMDLFLPKKPFARLITMIQPKFPDIVLPIPDCQSVASSLR